MDVYTERTLLISGSEKGLDAIINFLKGCGYAAVSVVSSGDEARRMLQQDTFGLIVLNTPLKDRLSAFAAIDTKYLFRCCDALQGGHGGGNGEQDDFLRCFGRCKAFESSGTAASDSDGESDARSNDAYESGKRQAANV